MKKLIVFVLLFITLLLTGCDIASSMLSSTTAQNDTTTKQDESTTKQEESTTKGLISTTQEGSTWTLPDMTGYTTAQVRSTLEASPLENWQIIVKGDLEYGNQEGQYEFEKFFGYAGAANVPGAEVSTTKKLNVYVTAYNLYSTPREFIQNNPSLNELYADVTLDGKNYTGTSFLQTGLGEVTVVSFVDGDTTRFKDSSGTSFSLRYLGVDTPESTAAFEPWGKAASAYTQECLTNAKKVVLESDEAGQADSNGRYLGWVWYQDSNDEWHLLQLEQVLYCYTKDKADSSSTYGKIITQVGTIIQRTGRRVWGEHDPNFDYSTDPKAISLEELRTNFANYYSRKVTITGVVAMLDGTSPVIVDPETGYGIFYYIPPWMANGAYDVQVGNVITITGVATYYGEADEDDLDSMDEDLGNGSPQLTDFKEKYVVLVSEGTYLDESTATAATKLSTVRPVELNAGELTSADLGRYCVFKNLTVTKVYEASTKSGYTVTCRDASGNEINIRVDDSHYYIEGSNEDGVAKDIFTVGKTITSVTGYLTYYYGFQLGLVSKTMIQFGN